MQSYGTQLKDYYQRELAMLREDASAFAQAFPAEANALQLDPSGSHDPHVEMLIQSFAFLTSRVQYETEVSKALVPNVLLNYLYPHLGAPVPSMLVAQVRVKPDDIAGEVLRRGRQVSVTTEDAHGAKTMCRFSTTYSVPLLPLGIADVQVLLPADYPKGMDQSQGLSALRVRVTALGSDAVKALNSTSLRFYLDANHKDAHFLQEILSLHLTGVGVAHFDQPLAPGGQRVDLTWLGFSDDEAALPLAPHAHPGHRLLQEYFAFPEKFMFFELGELDLAAFDLGFDLYFMFSLPISKSRSVSSQVLKLNCVPLINLYRQRIEPLTIDHTQYEYPLTADLRNRQTCEIFAIEELVAIRGDGSQRQLRPYFELNTAQTRASDDYFYVMRREGNQLGSNGGTEVFVSFLDTQQQSALPPAEVLGGRALCTNRALPEQLRVKQSLQLDGAGPITSLEVVSRPSRYITPPLVGHRPWALVSQLALSHLSLAEGPQALAAFKSMLRGHLGPSQVLPYRAIEGLRHIECKPGMRYLFRNGNRSYVPCLNIKLTMDRHYFESSSMVLFASVLRYFLALYSAVNTVVVVSLESTDAKGGLKQWPALVGAQIVL